jgi:hypothetical protein
MQKELFCPIPTLTKTISQTKSWTTKSTFSQTKMKTAMDKMDERHR